MNDYYSLSLLHLNHAAIEHEHKLSNWPRVLQQYRKEDRRITRRFPLEESKLAGFIQNLSTVFSSLVHSYDG